MTFVIDASIAIKWFVNEADSGPARSLLSAGHVLLGPDLVVAEVCNTVWRKQRLGQVTPAQGVAMAQKIVDLFDSLVPCAQLVPRAYEIAGMLDHPVYDCFYLALAESRNCDLITADERLLARLEPSILKTLARRLDSLRI
jgi:predicted nucleic acid-binding protein